MSLRIAPKTRRRNGGCIFADGLYTAEELNRAIRVGRKSLDQGRDDGFLFPVKLGKGHVYLGKDVLAYVEHLKAQQYQTQES